MVRKRGLFSFLREESGISLVEGLISLPFVMLVFAGAIEFSYAMFQWNQTVKAMQLGARVVAVSDWMLSAEDVDELFPSNVDATLVGKAIPPGLSHSCSSDNGAAKCVAGLERLVNGNGRWPGLHQFNPRIGVGNVIVTYQRTGLGYYGRPDGAVVTVRLALRTEPVNRVTFNLPLVGRLICVFSDEDPCAVLSTIAIPAMPVTVTSEDLKTASGA